MTLPLLPPLVGKFVSPKWRAERGANPPTTAYVRVGSSPELPVGMTGTAARFVDGWVALTLVDIWQ